ncbi:MAG: Glutamyl-tRNA reductase (EC [uncultured Sulfurovum sp.]|uniref:Glutamyl-tRNA reductase n=1 Tax=uncultured Sulfurovum sp. TaxID=269237 RepID=A0A6S6TTV2_9BACT|nr:MAG: Glutamyl-tRNA reductase (EC [uncultured Sulfurovum sp.]
MYYQVLAFNHHNCEQSLREQLAFTSEDEKKNFLNELVEFKFIHEAYIVSTCNRVEIFAATSDNFSSYHTILGLLSKKSQVDFYKLKSAGRCYDDEEAIVHTFSVVSSLDSVVIGESQITGQVKEDFRFSQRNGTAGVKLNRVLAHGLKCAAEVRNVTEISKNPISIASVAVAQAYKIYGENISGMRGVVIGTGEMGMIAAKHLLRLGCDVLLLGRDLEKTQRIAEELGENVKAGTTVDLPKYLNRYRLLFSATSSKEAIIEPRMIENPNFDRVWFDMAIPRDIGDMGLEKLRLFRIDDLKSISNENYALKQEQAIKAKEIVRRFKDEYYTWLKASSVEPVIRDMRLQVQEAIDKELSRAIKKKFVPEEYKENMQKMAEQMFNHFLHDATQNLRKCSTQTDGSKKIGAITDIFDIDPKRVNLQWFQKNEHNVKGYKS